MIDASDLLDVFAESMLKAVGSNKPRLSNWIASDLGGVIEYMDKPSIEKLVDIAAGFLAASPKVLDFGCGDGGHRQFFERKAIEWTGLDYGDSIDPTARKRIESGFSGKVVLYDGTVFPFNDGEFDAVWSYQSLEHVHSAEQAISEISRVLAPKGVLAGSVSFLEPYHARSTFSYTPYGFKFLCERSGLKLRKIFPTIDGASLVLRGFFMILGIDVTEGDNWNKMMKDGGAFNRVLKRHAQAHGMEKDLAEGMAQFCGHFYFVAQKDA